MKLLGINKSDHKDKKWVAIFDDNGKIIKTHFGNSNYEDFTQHKDPIRAERYRKRHYKDLKTKDPTRAGYLSYYILWQYPNINKAIEEYKKKFNL